VFKRFFSKPNKQYFDYGAKMIAKKAALKMHENI